jgi:hypothetical protein
MKTSQKTSDFTVYTVLSVLSVCAQESIESESESKKIDSL